MSQKSSKKSGKKTQKTSAKQREARLKAAEERERKAAEEAARKERWKKVGIIVVSVILVLGLGLPTIALSFLGGGA